MATSNLQGPEPKSKQTLSQGQLAQGPQSLLQEQETSVSSNQEPPQERSSDKRQDVLQEAAISAEQGSSKIQSSKNAPVQGEPLTPEQEMQIQSSAEYWRRVNDEAPIQAMNRAEESAKQLIGLTGALQAVYIGIYAFSDMGKRFSELTVPFGVKLLLFFLYFLPLLTWLVSLFHAARVFVGARIIFGISFNDLSPDAWINTKTAYESLVERRMKSLLSIRRSLELMIVSTAGVLILFGVLIFLLPAPVSTPTQIIILTPTPAVVSTPIP